MVKIDRNTSGDVDSGDFWIYGANSIHLAAKFMPMVLELLLSSLDDANMLVNVENDYGHSPLHVAARNNDSLSTRYANNNDISLSPVDCVMNGHTESNSPAFLAGLRLDLLQECFILFLPTQVILESRLL